MKKIGKILLVFIGLIMLTGCGKLTTFRSIDYNKYETMIDNKESFILFIGADSCSACALYKEYLDAVIKDYQVEVNYVNIDAFTEDEYSEFTSKINFGGSTPVTIYIEKGEEKSSYNRIKGAKNYDAIVESFTKNGYIK